MTQVRVSVDETGKTRLARQIDLGRTRRRVPARADFANALAVDDDRSLAEDLACGGVDELTATKRDEPRSAGPQATSTRQANAPPRDRAHGLDAWFLPPTL